MNKKDYIFPKTEESLIHTFSVICGSNPPDYTNKGGDWEAPARVSKVYV